MEEPELLLRLARNLARNSPEAPLPLRLCSAFSHLVGADGGSVSMDLASTDRALLCATDDWAARIEDAQDVVREGPSLDAFQTGQHVVGLPRDEQIRRWPLLAEMLGAEFRARRVDAFPITPDARVVGVILVHLDQGRPLSVDVVQAQFLANAVGVALLGELDASSLSDDTWSARDRVDQATGMVAAQLRISPTDARAVLRAHAYAHATSLATVSGWVLARDLTFSDLDSSDGSAS